MVTPPEDRRRLAQRERLKLPRTRTAALVSLLLNVALFVTALALLPWACACEIGRQLRALVRKIKGERK